MKKRQLKTLKLKKGTVAGFDNTALKGGLIPFPIASAQTNCVQNRLCQNISLDLPINQCR